MRSVIEVGDCFLHSSGRDWWAFKVLAEMGPRYVYCETMHVRKDPWIDVEYKKESAEAEVPPDVYLWFKPEKVADLNGYAGRDTESKHIPSREYDRLRGEVLGLLGLNAETSMLKKPSSIQKAALGFNLLREAFSEESD